jgi:hypothetical protein
MPSLFSDRFDIFMHSFQPRLHHNGDTRFPAGVERHHYNIAGNENAHTMLNRVLHDVCGGDVSLISIEDDLAVVADVRWRNANDLATTHIQAVKTNGVNIATFLAGAGNQNSRYFRFDCDARVGMLFTHPYPHIHFVPGENETRYSLNGWRSQNPVMDFFEHIYLECYYQQWLEWARGVWAPHWAAVGYGQPNPFQAFRDSQYAALEQYEAQINALKGVLRQKKDQAYRLRSDAFRREIAIYP